MPAVRTTVVLLLRKEIADAYDADAALDSLMAHLRMPSEKTLKALSRSTRSHVGRYRLINGIVFYLSDIFDAPRVLVPNDSDLCARILHEYQDTPTGATWGESENTIATVSRDYY